MRRIVISLVAVSLAAVTFSAGSVDTGRRASANGSAEGVPVDRETLAASSADVAESGIAGPTPLRRPAAVEPQSEASPLNRARSDAALRPAPTRGNFLSSCRFSHRLPDDPIVFPGGPGLSHSHDFFANTSTNADSTYASLRAAETTCHRPGDTAAYWVPTLSMDGQPVRPIGVNAYYLTGGKDGRTIRPFPAGLKVIAGNGRAVAPQPPRVTSWSCGPEAGVPRSSDVPTCPAGSRLRLHIRFPDCWNGRDVDTADHKSHMAYSFRRSCPSSHPVPVPALQLNVVYDSLGGDNASLASGSIYSGHADFFNAWDQTVLRRLVVGCLNAGRHCGRRS